MSRCQQLAFFNRFSPPANVVVRVLLAMLAVALGAFPAAAQVGPAADRVQWNFKGRIVDGNPTGEDVVHEFDKNGMDGSAIDEQHGVGSSLLFSPNASADSRTHTLKSGARIEGLAHNWISSSAYGIAGAYYDDRVYVQTSGSAQGYVEFTWSIDGLLRTEVTASPVDAGPFFWSNHADVDLVGLFGAAGQPLSRSALFQRSISRGSISQAEADCEVLINAALEARLDNNETIFNQASVDIGTQSERLFVPFNPGAAVDLTFGLVTCVNFRLVNEDIGTLEFAASARFNNTASLTSVRVLDANLQPWTTPYQLISENGLTYPIQVPEPSSVVLAVVGLLVGGAALARRRGRGESFEI